MFTGIIEETGTVEKVERSKEPVAFTFRAEKVLSGLQAGDSVSVNGACLTVVNAGRNRFSAQAVRETLGKTNLNDLKPGDRVNLESSLKAGGKISGHFVTGHVDGTGIVKGRKDEKGEILFEISAPEDILSGIVLKGSVSIDGVSLTVSRIDKASFSFVAIPHTAKATTLAGRKAGDKVNIETDVLGKYAAKNCACGPSSKITEEFLRDNGF